MLYVKTSELFEGGPHVALSVWTYRWRDLQDPDMFCWVYLDAHGIVRRARPGMEVRNGFSPWGM